MCIRDRAREGEEASMLREKLLSRQHGRAQCVLEQSTELQVSHERNEALRLDLKSAMEAMDRDRRAHAAEMESLSQRQHTEHRVAMDACAAQYKQELAVSYTHLTLPTIYSG
eukprot:TRINITY_DN15290_c0_g1_i1.p1 TRINITY_DN15290_c0_g1~~TRINITY_DN15290_c0_g1_i1.p1  ORF type:complete len:112 (+),score=47.81 TRINITY_DN15290_c0_g1_i1:81-416(+)